MKKVITFVCCISLSVIAHAQRHSFEWLPDLAGGGISSRAFAISDDGNVIVGASWTTGGPQAARWDSNGVISLGDLASFVDDSVAYGISPDGSMITGVSRSDIGREAFLWQGEMQGLGFLGPGQLMYSYGNDITADGTVFGQSVSSGGYHAFVFENDELIELPHYNGPFSAAIAATASGQYVVGGASEAAGVYYAVKWVNREGPIRLGPNVESMACGVTEDGNIIVGRAAFSDRDEAFLWTPENGMVGLEDFPNSSGESIAWGVSADGSRIIGHSSLTQNNEACIWDEHGIRSLTDILAANCINTEGIRSLHDARGISADGRIIVGNGITIDGNIRGFKIRLPFNNNPNDVNDDGMVDINDLSALASSFGSCTGEPNFNPTCDIDCNGCVTVVDLTGLISSFGSN